MLNRFRNIGLLILLLLAGRMAAQVPVLDSVCSGAVRYYGVQGEDGSTYTWILTLPDGSTDTLPSDADTLKMVWDYPPDVYEIKAVQHAENRCDADAVFGRVFVFGQPDVNAGPDDVVCIDDFYKLEDATAANTGSLLWTTDGDGTFSDPTALNPAYFPGSNDILAGTVTLRLTGLGMVADGGCDPSFDNMTLSIRSEIVPQFEPIGDLCLYSTAPALPDTSLEGYLGTWNPAVINTDILGTFQYTFSPTDTAGCAIDTTISVTITDTIVPLFNPIGPLCINSVPPALPDISLEGITGTWVPDTISTDVTGTFTYQFTPSDSTQCGVETTMDIAIVTELTPLFGPIGPYCQYTTPPVLPDSSINHISGTWVPPTIETDSAGTFDYNFIADPDECGTDTTIQITIIEQVDPLFEPIDTLCQYATAPPLPDSSINGISGTWNPAWINTSVPGTFTYTFTPNDPSQCGTEFTMDITIIEEITPSFATIDPLCQYSPPPVLPDTSLEGIHGTWNPPVISTDELGIFSFDFTPDSSYQCVLPKSILVVVIPETTPTFETIDPLCQYIVPPALPDTSIEGISGTWVPPAIITSDTGTFIYVFTPDDEQCATGDVEIEIEITDQIIPEFDPIGPLCQNYPPPALPDTSLNDIAGTWDPPTINTDVTGTFSFTFTPDSTYQCAIDTTILIAVVSGTVPEFDPIGPLCQYDLAPKLPDTSINNVSGTWTPPAINTDVAGTFSFTFNPDTEFQCAVDTTIMVTILPAIMPEFDTIYPVCQNSVPPVLPAESNDGIQGTWDPAVIITTVPGNFTYTFTPDSSELCATVVIKNIAIVTEIVPQFNPIGPLCQNSQAPLLPATSNDSITGTWNPPVINTNVPGSVTYTFTPDDGQCADSTTMVVVINVLPDVFAGADQSIPLGTGTTIGDATASGNGPLTYSWVPAGLLLDPALLNPTTVNLTLTTTFTLTVTDTNGCENSDEVTIIVGGEQIQAETIPGDHCLDESVIVPLMVDQFISVASFQLKLSYNKDVLSVPIYDNLNPQIDSDDWNAMYDPANGVITIQWNSSTPLTFSGQEKLCDLMFTPTQIGLGQLDWYTGLAESYFFDQAGLPIPAVFFAGDLIITDPPEIMLKPSITVCVGDSITIKSAAIGMYPPLTYKWTYPDGHISTADPVISYATDADAGDYVLVVTDSVGCDDQKSIRVIVSPNPVAAFHDSDTLVVPQGYILEAGSGLAFYQWNTGEMTESIRIDTTGWYWVDMTTYADCIGTDSVYVVVSDEVQIECLWIPNAFTPDHDGLNDTFKPVTRCELSFYRMFIYNRWGEKLFESSDISIGWDGMYNGVLCPGDVYVYKIAYRAAGVPDTEFEKVRAGTVLILK